MKILEESVMKILQNIGVGEDFLGKTPNSRNNKSKTKQMHEYIKHRSYRTVKEISIE